MKKKISYKTGLVTESETTARLRLESKPTYVKMYVDDLAAILELSVGIKGLLYELVQRIDDDETITLRSTTKKEIAHNRLQITIGTFDNYLTMLVKVGVLKRIRRGKFEANPYLFPHREWEPIGQQPNQSGRIFRMSITYLPSGERKIEGNLIN